MLGPQTEWVYSVCSRSVFNEQIAERETFMSTRQMIQLWRHARQVEEPFYLATVVFAEGSAFRDFLRQRRERKERRKT